MADKSINGRDYIVKAEHPRRPGMPLRITKADGTLLAVGGESCDGIAPDLLASMLASGYIERAPRARKA